MERRTAVAVGQRAIVKGRDRRLGGNIVKADRVPAGTTQDCGMIPRGDRQPGAPLKYLYVKLIRAP